jgi:hypothetical protein
VNAKAGISEGRTIFYFRVCAVCEQSIDIVTTFCGDPVCRVCAKEIPDIEAAYAEIDVADADAPVGR